MITNLGNTDYHFCSVCWQQSYRINKTKHGST